VGARQLLTAGKQGGDVEQTYLVPGKVRPVLIVSDAPATNYGDVLALRLTPLEKLHPDEQQIVREHGDPMLFHLPPDRFDMPNESAAMVSTLFRLHVDAVDTETSLGQLDANEWRVLGERLVRHLRFDLRLLFQQYLESRRSDSPSS
jgi:hypothetical protein